MISSVIDVEGENERMVLVTGSSTTHPGADTRADCNSTFTYKTCILEPGVAEYDVEVQGDEILMDKIGDPKFVSNVNYPVQKAKGGNPHDSTVRSAGSKGRALRLTKNGVSACRHYS